MKDSYYKDYMKILERIKHKRRYVRMMIFYLDSIILLQTWTFSSF